MSKQKRGLNEAESRVLEHTRVSTKKRKNWQGSRKPRIDPYDDSKFNSEEEQKKALEEQGKILMKEFWKTVRFPKTKKTNRPEWDQDDAEVKGNVINFFTCPYCGEDYAKWKHHEKKCPYY